MKFPLLSSLSLAALSLSVYADNWPTWRGPAGDGVCTEPASSLPKSWSATENVRWKVALPEKGNSTPIVWDDKVFMTQPVGARRTLICFARQDGKQLWQEGPTYEGQE